MDNQTTDESSPTRTLEQDIAQLMVLFNSDNMDITLQLRDGVVAITGAHVPTVEDGSGTAGSFIKPDRPDHLKDYTG